jgi:hypothetical protein
MTMNKRLDPATLERANVIAGDCPAAAIAYEIQLASELADRIDKAAVPDDPTDKERVVTGQIEVSSLVDHLGEQLDWVVATSPEGLHAQALQLFSALNQIGDPDYGVAARRRVDRLLHRLMLGLEAVGEIPAERRLESRFWVERGLDKFFKSRLA